MTLMHRVLCNLGCHTGVVIEHGYVRCGYCHRTLEYLPLPPDEGDGDR